MTPSVVDSPTAATLDIPVRVLSHETPFWHRRVPLVAVTHLDPAHAALRAAFPATWEHLVRAKTLLDGTAVLDSPRVPVGAHRQRIGPLLVGAAYELLQLADAEDDGGRAAVARPARASARRLLGYADTGEWPTVALTAPEPGEPWLYCGPLNTWAVHARSVPPLGLLVVRPRPDFAGVTDAVDERIDDVRAAVVRALGGPVRSTMARQPTMHLGDLVLAGGEPAFGHKNFAHFFPLEAPGSHVDDAEFTVVFANVHAERLRRCSLALLAGHLDEPRAGDRFDDRAVFDASVQWFRCHDLAHFWRLESFDAPDAPLPALSAFERMTLEEAYADMLGVVSAAAVVPVDRLGRAFAAELLRYLSREYSNFADSAAAVLTIGWLRRATGSAGLGTGWLARALPAFADLAAAIHGVLFEGADAAGSGPHRVDELRAAMHTGKALRDGLTALFDGVPTDLDYTFG